jgi:alpha-beta hydrolase superfamily lysophospholipase
MTQRLTRLDDRTAGANCANPALDQAMLRAYSLERAVDYGCSLDDTLELRRSVESGESWIESASGLGANDLRRAAIERESDRPMSASAFSLHAAACFRLAQAALEEDVAGRLNMCERQLQAFRQGIGADDHAEVEVTHNGASHRGWLFKPAQSRDPPCVLVWGGADGWCEAFYASVPFYLERGLAVCLLELPGQGLARLRNGSLLRTDFTAMLSTAMTLLAGHQVAPNAFGVVGHSMGGSLAIAAAAADDRIKACCTNGGSVYLERGLQKYPRVLARVGRMLDRSNDETLDFVRSLRLAEAASAMRAELLCLQGGRDVLVDSDEAQSLIELRGPERSALEVWPEGVHCLYNHAFERNCILTDWFATQLH